MRRGGAPEGRAPGRPNFDDFSRVSTDLPRGWEEGFTEEGASYFIE